MYSNASIIGGQVVEMKLRHILIAVLVLLNVADIVTTLMVMFKHKMFGLEINPLAVIGFPLWTLILLKVVMTAVLVWIYIRYSKISNAYSRFLLCYIIWFIIIMLTGIIFNNINTYIQDTDMIEPLPPEKRIDAYKEQALDLQVYDRVKPVQYRLPSFFTMMFGSLVTFFIWRRFEGE